MNTTERDEVMNPPRSAAEGLEAGNLNTSHTVIGHGACPEPGETPVRADVAQATRVSAAPKPLFIPLKGVYFDLFKSGEKQTEYRPYGPRWNERTCPVGRAVVLSRGYGKAHRLHGVVTGFEMRRDIVRTRAWQEIYGRKHEHVACIQIKISANSIAGQP